MIILLNRYHYLDAKIVTRLRRDKTVRSRAESYFFVFFISADSPQNHSLSAHMDQSSVRQARGRIVLEIRECALTRARSFLMDQLLSRHMRMAGQIFG